MNIRFQSPEQRTIARYFEFKECLRNCERSGAMRNLHYRPIPWYSRKEVKNGYIAVLWVMLVVSLIVGGLPHV